MLPPPAHTLLLGSVKIVHRLKIGGMGWGDVRKSYVPNAFASFVDLQVDVYVDVIFLEVVLLLLHMNISINASSNLISSCLLMKDHFLSSLNL